MDIGMLWFDDSARSFGEKVRRAADYYAEKYGHPATLCLVNPETWQKGDWGELGIEVRQARMVMPSHFWIGVDEAGKASRRARGSEVKAEADVAPTRRSAKRVVRVTEPEAKAA
jgi:hypothetical protein